jgi:hypothetical protein
MPTNEEVEDAIQMSPETYRELCIPFNGPDAANENLIKFQKELYDLRCRYRICELLFIAQVPIKYPDGDEGSPTLVGYYGDKDKAEGMAHFAAGRMSAERQERIAKVAEKASKSIRAGQVRK